MRIRNSVLAIAASIALLAGLVPSLAAVGANGTNSNACNLTASVTSCSVAVPTGGSTCSPDISGTWTGQLDFAVVGKVTSSPINATPPNSSTAVTNTTANGIWNASPGSAITFKVTVDNPGAFTGTSVVNLRCSPSVPPPAPGASGGSSATPAPCATNGPDTGCLTHNQNNLPAVTVVASTAPQAAATTQPLVAGSTSVWTYVAYAAVQGTGVNTTDSIALIAGATSTNACDTPEAALTINVGATLAGVGNGQTLVLWGGALGINTGVTGVIPASQDIVIPPNTPAINLCLVYAGTTIAAKGIVAYTTRTYGLGFVLENLLKSRDLVAYVRSHNGRH